MRRVEVGQAKVDDLDIAGMRNENILDLQVPMYDAIPMTILQRRADLPRELPRHAFSKSSMRDDVIEHLSAVDVLEDHVVVVRVDDQLAHAADVRVVEQLG